MPRIRSTVSDDAAPASFRKWLVPVVSVLAVVGGAVAVAAIDGEGDPVVNEEPVTTTSHVTADTPDVTPEGDGVERYWGSECGDGEATNHGQYVSSSPTGGESRREAAQSPCGKPLTAVDGPNSLVPGSQGQAGEHVPGGPSTQGTTNGGGPPEGKGGPKHT